MNSWTPTQPTPTADASIPTNARRPLPFLGGSLTYWCSCNSSSYHSLQTKVEKRFSNDLSFLAAYTWGKSIDEVSQASLGFNNSVGFRDQHNRRAEKARSDYDIAHRFVVSYTYELPFGRNLTGPRRCCSTAGRFSASTPSTPATRTPLRPGRISPTPAAIHVPTVVPVYHSSRPSRTAPRAVVQPGGVPGTRPRHLGQRRPQHRPLRPG